LPERGHRPNARKPNVSTGDLCERVGKLTAVRGALLDVLRQHPIDEQDERRWNAGPDLGDGDRIVEQDLREHRGRVMRLKCAPPGEALIEDATEREHVRARVYHGASERLFGRHEVKASDDHAGARERECLGGAARDAEVEHLYTGVPRHDQVLRLDVAVHDAEGVRGAECFCDLATDLDDITHRQRPERDEPSEGLAVQPLHRQVPAPFTEGSVRDVLDDPGMLQRLEEARLAVEAVLRVPRRGVQHLHGNDRAAGFVNGAIHASHPPDARFAVEYEPVDAVSLLHGGK